MPKIAVKQLNVPTKGDVISTDGTTAQVLGVGSDGQILSADSAEATGLKWINSGAVDTENQDSLTTEAISGSDTAMASQLVNTPQNNASVNLHFNGVHQEQGAGKDYTITGKIITWLASSGTAVDQAVGETLVASYVS
jgi:hypothetical protein